MKYKHYLIGIISLFASFSLFALDLTVTVTNIESNQGVIHIGLFTKDNHFPDPLSKQKGITLTADRDHVTVIFTDLPSDYYAIAIFHDENNNNIIDKNFFRIPKESYGFSGKNTSFTPPSFDEARIHLLSDTALTIKLR